MIIFIVEIDVLLIQDPGRLSAVEIVEHAIRNAGTRSVLKNRETLPHRNTAGRSKLTEVKGGVRVDGVRADVTAVTVVVVVILRIDVDAAIGRAGRDSWHSASAPSRRH